MRVLHVLNTGKFSGAENVVCQINNMFKDDESYNMAYCSFDGEIRQILEEKDFSFFPVEKMNVKELKRVIKEYNPDIIHAHDMKAGFTVARACGRIPMVSHIHNNAYDSRGVSLKSIAYLYAAKKAKKIIWVSKSAFEGYVFHKFFKKKSVILYNVIDQLELLDHMNKDLNSYDYDVVYIGRITFQKNPQRLLKILRMVCDKLPQISVAIIGTGELDEEIVRECTQLKLDDNISFLGFQKNPLKCLHDSKVMVLTSRWEGTPMVALEAIALGVPIISTPTDGMNELITNGVNGYLTDDDELFVEHVVRLVSDKNILEDMKNNQLKLSDDINNVSKYKSVLLSIYE